MRRSIVLGLLAAVALLALSATTAGAKPTGANGRIVFGRYDPNLGDTVLYTINPDGTNEQQLRPDPLECPNWSPDGKYVAGCVSPEGGASRIIDVDNGSYRDLPMPAGLFAPCSAWSPDGARLACEGFGESDSGLNGLYTVRSSDGGDLTRLTYNPGGDDVAGSYSPDGKRFVFYRFAQDGTFGLFVVNSNGTGLKQITPTGMDVGITPDWSPQGNDIVFSRHVTSDSRSSLWIAHADGTGLREVLVQPASMCGGAVSDPGSAGCLEPRWSPDGTKIVFARGRSLDADGNVYTVNVDGTGLAQVTHGGHDQMPDWGIHPLIP